MATKKEKGAGLVILLIIGWALFSKKGSATPDNENLKPKAKDLTPGKKTQQQNVYTDEPGNAVSFIGKYLNAAQAAVDAAPPPGIDSAFILSVAGLETGWGTSGIFKASNNAFGIHADSSWHGATYTPPGDPNNAPFRKYTTVADSFADFLAYLVTNSNYKPLWNSKTSDPMVWAKLMDSTHYSESPDYSAKLEKIVPLVQKVIGQQT